MRSLCLLVAAWPLAAADAAFVQKIRPVLNEHCASCHNPANPKNKVGFLRAQTPADLQRDRGTWRKVAAHLRNRTMPPVANKLAESDRLAVAQWVDQELRATACTLGEQAGAVMARRLNRREYRYTVRDLFGLDFNVEDLFPADDSGGEGFDNNGETLYVPPLLMERYVEAAQQLLDRVIITPSLSKLQAAHELRPGIVAKEKALAMQPGEQISAAFQTFLEGDYDVRVSIHYPKDREKFVHVLVDGNDAGRINYRRDPTGGPTYGSRPARLARGQHTITVKVGDAPVEFYSIRLEHRQPDPSAEKRALHYRLLGLEPGQVPINPRATAERLLARLLPRAFRRPVTPAEVARLLTLYDRGAERGDPFEESIKLALKGVLLSPDFLFRIEKPAPAPNTPLSGHELATRLSYFLWSTMPDDELRNAAPRLQDPKVLEAQLDRMLDDPRSRAFAENFIGQWLGTKDVGGRLVPTVSSVQQFYTPDVAVELRTEPVLLFHHLLAENRSLLELLTASYTFLTERLVKFYEFEGRVKITSPGFQKVNWPDDRRAGLLGMGSVLAMTSHYQQTSPVLRGAWVLDTLLGTPAPAPPADVPPLETGSKSEKGLTTRQKLARHKTSESCAACHNLIDPIGFALENFDWIGRWRDTEAGKPVDAEGQMPTGEKFSGPQQLRALLTKNPEPFARQVTGKVLGYALGRSLEDRDHCTIQRLTEALARDGYRTRTLVREIVLGTAFRASSPATGKETEAGPARKKMTPRQAQ